METTELQKTSDPHELNSTICLRSFWGGFSCAFICPSFFPVEFINKLYHAKLFPWDPKREIIILSNRCAYRHKIICYWVGQPSGAAELEENGKMEDYLWCPPAWQISVWQLKAALSVQWPFTQRQHHTSKGNAPSKPGISSFHFQSPNDFSFKRWQLHLWSINIISCNWLKKILLNVL